MSNSGPQTPTSRPQDKSEPELSSDLTSQELIYGNTVNERNRIQQNATSPIASPGSQDAASPPDFKSATIAPTPPLHTHEKSIADSTLLPLDTAPCLHLLDTQSQHSSPLSAGLRIQTDINLCLPGYTNTPANNTGRNSTEISQRLPRSPSFPLQRTPSIKNILATSVGSNSNFGSAPSSAFSSPMLNAMADVTPLPSPLLSGDSPGPWKTLVARPQLQDGVIPVTANSALITTNGELISSAIANQSKRRAYHGLTHGADSPLINSQIIREKNGEGHAKNRSLSEYMPEQLQSPKVRQITVSGSHAPIPDPIPDLSTSPEMHMRREPHLALQRGLAPMPRPPTPPSSRTGESSDSDSSLTRISRLHKKPRYEYFDAYSRGDTKLRRWRALKLLGEGTFSRVMLATSQIAQDDRIDEDDVFGAPMEGVVKSEEKIDPKKLVAVKVCEHGPKGGASEERVEMSLKRELEIMKSIRHPSLVHLKAWNVEETRAILVLSYCPGGDLFEVASEYGELLVPSLLRRMFVELVGAVRYLHERHIVHRDIKLENVLVNVPKQELAKSQDWATYPYSIVTLTDLGLSRRVADDEKLATRCGSDDYAAPEVIMGQPYDGRATDAWSLGVLLYALLENRLPFDPNPGMSEGHKQRSRTSHRIARVEWRWMEYAGDDGDHEGDEPKFEQRGLKGAMLITEGLLKRARTRWTLEKVAEVDWVRDAILVEGGLKFREEDNPEELVFDVHRSL